MICQWREPNYKLASLYNSSSCTKIGYGALFWRVVFVRYSNSCIISPFPSVNHQMRHANLNLCLLTLILTTKFNSSVALKCIGTEKKIWWNVADGNFSKIRISHCLISVFVLFHPRQFIGYLFKSIDFLHALYNILVSVVSICDFIHTLNQPNWARCRDRYVRMVVPLRPVIGYHIKHPMWPEFTTS